MRVLHILSNIKQDSGVMNVVMNYYRNIDRSKYQFDFLYFESKDEKLEKEICDLGGNIYFIEKPSLKRLIRTFNVFNNFFRKYRSRYHIIHLHEIYLVHFIGYFCKKYGIKRLITHAHTTKYSDNPKNAFRNKLMCAGLKSSATDYFACSKAAGRFYYGVGMVDNGNVKIVPNAINIEKYKFDKNIRNELRKKLNIEKNFVIGHVGRMVIQKNQKFLLKIFRKILNKRKDVILLIVGDGPLRNELETIIEQLDMKNNVLLLGAKEDVYKYYSVMDVFVLPSLFEGFPVVGLEAQANGLKCVFSSNITEEVGLYNCVFLKLENIDDWVSVLSQNYNIFVRDYLHNDALLDYNMINCVRNLEVFYEKMR